MHICTGPTRTHTGTYAHILKLKTATRARICTCGHDGSRCGRCFISLSPSHRPHRGFHSRQRSAKRPAWLAGISYSGLGFGLVCCCEATVAPTRAPTAATRTVAPTLPSPTPTVAPTVSPSLPQPATPTTSLPTQKCATLSCTGLERAAPPHT
jgi:hypothetical protein